MQSICQVVQSVYDVDVRVRRKAEALVAAGYGVDVLALAPAENKKAYTLNGVNVYTICLGKNRGSLMRYFYEYMVFFFWTMFSVTSRMFCRRYAVIDVNTLPDFLIFAAVPARWMGAKLVLDMHEITPEFYRSKYGIDRGSWVVWLLEFQERISFRCADRVIAISEPVQDLMVQRGLRREFSMVLMNAVDESRFAAKTEPTTAQGASNGFVMMYHGTLTRLYGLDIAIEAFRVAHTEMPGAELWILGGGPEKKELHDLAKRYGLSAKIRLVGQVKPEEIPSWLSRCDAGLLPIRRDVFLDYAFPNKLPEFIIMDKPVVMSRLKVIRHYFREKSLAYFEPNDPADLAKTMIRLYKNREERKVLTANARQDYAPISWTVMRERYLDLMERLIGMSDVAVVRSNPSTDNSIHSA